MEQNVDRKRADRVKFACCNEGFDGWSWPQVVSCLARIGYDAVEIAPFTFADHVGEISPSQRLEINATAADAGLAISGLHWLLVRPEGLHLTHPDAGVRARTRDYLLGLVDFCADVGGRIMTFGSPNQRNVEPGCDPRAAREWAINTFRAVGEHAHERDVVVCLEALPASLTNFLNTTAEVIQLVREIDQPSIRMMLDVKSMAGEERPIPEIIRSAEGWFDHFHANDSNLKGPGFGDIDFVPIFHALADVGYDGYVSVEAFDFKPDPETVARESLRYMKECLAGLDQTR
ncbi:MAG: sugar phosphate isomerase/epimerase [Firmicutes bacterium]|jgi:sugar phosphate isomerase/epimerase|nr:sugar phosphate isomerase/epimerase [Bacillota bacterium]